MIRIPKIKDNILFTPSLLICVLFLSFQVFLGTEFNRNNFHNLIFSFSFLLCFLCTFVINFAVLEDIIQKSRRIKIIQLVFDVVAMISQFWILILMLQPIRSEISPTSLLILLFFYQVLFFAQLFLLQRINLVKTGVLTIGFYVLSILIFYLPIADQVSDYSTLWYEYLLRLISFISLFLQIVVFYKIARVLISR